MLNITVGDRVLVIKGVYKSKVGTVVKVYKSEPRFTTNTYELMLDTPAHVTITVDGKDLVFEDHKTIIQAEEELKPLTKLGEVIYGDLEDAD